MPNDIAPYIGSVRFEKRVTVVMIHRESWNNTNDVNGGKPYKDREVVLAQHTSALHSSEVAPEIAKVA